jgi:DNA polymerase I
VIVNTEGPPNAKIFLVGEAPGKDEDAIGKPFVGYAGRTLNWLLSQSGINRPECLVGNVARERPPANKISFYFEDKKCTIPKPKLRAWIEQLRQEILMSDANVIVALGVTALWALTGEKKIGSFRGYAIECSLVPGKKVIPTYHPQAVNFDWKLHFPTILDLRKARFHSEFQGLSIDRTITVPNAPKETFIKYCQEILDNPDFDKITTDIETVQPGSHVSMIGFAHSPNFAMSTRFLNGKIPALPENDEKELWYWIGRVLEEKQIIIQNASYDLAVILMNHGILIKNLWMDTLLAAHCCFPELPRDLGFLGSILLDIPPWKHTAEDNKSLYNALDCARTHGIALALDKEMNRTGVRDTFDFEMSELAPAIMLQLQGTKVDKTVQQELSAECDKIVALTGKELEGKLGKVINYNSSKQLQQLLYIELGLPVQYKRRKSINDPRKISADKEALKKLQRLVPDNPIFNLIIEHKKYAKYKRDFVDIELSPEDKVHTSYNITGKKMDNKDTSDEGKKSFGRWSSSGSIILPYGSGNLQNIPEFARKMYTAPEGYEYICADYVQAEAVVVAYLINDMRSKTLFINRRNAPYEEKHNFDIHRQTASQMFGIPLDEVTKDHRRVGKTLRHAGNYDSGPSAISATLGCTIKEAKVLKELYHRTTPQLRLWYQRIQDKLKQDRTLVNRFGRIHRFIGRLDENLYRSAYAFDPQSTVGDLMNRSIVRMYNTYGERIWMVLQLHDGVYVLSPIGRRDETISMMLECMMETVYVNQEEMIIEVDFKAGPNWRDLKEFNHEELLK